MTDFGSSYPPGCSGVPDDDAPGEPICRCGHLESDHDAETGVCVEVLPEPCDCEGFESADTD